LGKRGFWRFPRILIWLVLLDEQYDVRADGAALFRWRVRVRAGRKPAWAGGQQDFCVERVRASAGGACCAERRGTRRRKVDQQHRRNWNICCSSFVDGIGCGCLRAVRDERDVGGFSDSGESAIRTEFVWSDLFWFGGAGIGFCDGRRDSRSGENIARS